MRRKLRLIGGGILVLALAVVGLGGYLLNDALAESGRMQGTTARIEELKLESSRDHEGRTRDVYRPTLTFTDTAGQVHTVLSRTAVYPAPGKVGETIPVDYDPADATSVRPRGAGQGYILPIIWLVVGGFLGLIGWTLFRLRR